MCTSVFAKLGVSEVKLHQGPCIVLEEYLEKLRINVAIRRMVTENTVSQSVFSGPGASRSFSVMVDFRYQLN